MEQRPQATAALAKGALVLLLAGSAGFCASVASILLADVLTPRRMAMAAAALVFPVLALVTWEAKRILLVGWVASYTFVRAYFHFDALTGDQGPFGIYWIPSDLLFGILLAIWGYELLTGNARRPRSRPLWPWFLPFVVACALSTLAAETMVWALSDLLRVLKFGLVLAYVRFNFGRTEWWLALSGLALAVVGQSALALLQMTTHTFSLSPLEGETMARGAGTMLHPNLLGPYLLLATPPLLSCGLAVSPLPFKPLWLGAGAAGLLGIACTLSRSPWVVALAEGALLMAGLLVLRRIGVQRVVGLATLSAIVLGLALLPFKDRILRRLTSNLTDSFEERGRLNRIALLSAAEHPFLGVGLNNQSLPILRHAPQHRGALEFAYEAKGKKVRMMVSIHNFFLMLLVETGLVGLGAFLVFVGSRLGAAVRALPGLTGAWQAACLGLIVGLVGLLAQMWGDFSLWMDPSFYTVALFIAMLHVAPSLAHAQPEAFERRWNDWRRRR